MLSTSTATVNTTEPIVSTSFTIPCSEDRVDGSSAAETASKSLQEAFRKYREDKLVRVCFFFFIIVVLL